MVDTFDPHLSCEKVKHAEDIEDYVLKEVSLDGEKRNPLLFETPYKTISSLGLQAMVNKKIEINDLIELREQPTIVECPVYVSHPKTWAGIGTLIESSENNIYSFKKIIKYNSYIGKLNPDVVVPTVVFNKNPFVERKTSTKRIYPPLNEEHFETFLQNIYTHSKNMLLVPDVKFGKRYNADIDEYKRIIAKFIEIFSERNNKPIFVPIQPTITNKAINNIIDFYREKKYSNIWIDYAGSALNETNQSGVRMILRALDKAFGDNYVVYHSLMKKELTTPIESDLAPSSDILSQFFGADFIGCTVKPWRYAGDQTEEKILQRGFKSIDHYNPTLDRSKSRIFDPDTYYYTYPSSHKDFVDWGINELDFVKKSTLINALNTSYKYQEIEKVKAECANNKKISPYIKAKKLFIENSQIYSNVIGETADVSWMEF